MAMPMVMAIFRPMIGPMIVPFIMPMSRGFLEVPIPMPLLIIDC